MQCTIYYFPGLKLRTSIVHVGFAEQFRHARYHNGEEWFRSSLVSDSLWCSNWDEGRWFLFRFSFTLRVYNIRDENIIN